MWNYTSYIPIYLHPSTMDKARLPDSDGAASAAAIGCPAPGSPRWPGTCDGGLGNLGEISMISKCNRDYVLLLFGNINK